MTKEIKPIGEIIVYGPDDGDYMGVRWHDDKVLTETGRKCIYGPEAMEYIKELEAENASLYETIDKNWVHHKRIIIAEKEAANLRTENAELRKQLIQPFRKGETE